MTNKILKPLDLTTKRKIAKIGMSASLATLVVSSFFLKNKGAKIAHTAAGVSLVAFSIIHHNLYPKN